MKRILIVAMLSPSISMPAYASESDVWSFVGGSVVGWLVAQHSIKPATPIVVTVQPQYQMYSPPPQYVTPMYGNQCPILDGVQTVPILKTNRYGYYERVGCGFIGGW
jgi:hypothetical protein